MPAMARYASTHVGMATGRALAALALADVARVVADGVTARTVSRASSAINFCRTVVVRV